jgi:acyl-CoA synthetase (AMP-forming)/AMP-acid ligase II
MTVASPLVRISDSVAREAQRRPDAPALALGSRRYTYGELALAVDGLAASLLAAGIRKGDRIAVLATPHPDFVVTLLAAASIGAIWVGLNPRYRIDELTYVMTDAEPSLLLARSRIAERDYAGEIAHLVSACPGLKRTVIFDADPAVAGADAMRDFLAEGSAISRERLDGARAAVSGRDPCLIVYTSGSTGSPKGALLHHAGITAFSRLQNELWPVDAPKMVNYFPINHIGSVIDCTLPCLAAGGTVFFMEQFDPGACLALMEREAVNVWGSVPSVFQLQLGLPDFESYDLSAVRLILWEGAALPEALIRRLLRICPRLATNYGMTETTSAITIVEPTDDIDVLAHTVGVPFPGVDLRIVDASGAVVGVGAAGEVQTHSPYNFLGYWRRPDITAQSFTPDGYFRTGDLAERRPDGRIRLVGRIKEMYKSGGYNVYPREVELVLEAHPAVALAAVVAVPDPLWQEVGVAYVAPRSAVTAAELDAHCRARLANYKIPKRIVIEPDLPLLPIGKVDKRALAARAADER